MPAPRITLKFKIILKATISKPTFHKPNILSLDLKIQKLMQLYTFMLKSEEKSYFSLARAVYDNVVANVSYALTTRFTIIHLLCLKVQNWQGTFTYSK